MREFCFGIVIGISREADAPIEVPLSMTFEGSTPEQALQALFPTAQLRQLTQDGNWLVYLPDLPVGHFATSQLVVRVHEV